MTKKELIKALSKFDGDTEIRFATRKNPPRTLYCVGGVENNALGAILYAD